MQFIPIRFVLGCHRDLQLKEGSDQQLVMEKELVKNMGVLKLRKMESTFLAEQAAISN